MPVSVEQLGKAIVAAGLMSADELKALWSKLPAGGRPKDGQTFAGLLVKEGKLTEFQSQELLSGSATPLVLGDYVLLSKIGAGGMGQVFKAQHRHMKRLVAIKLLPAATTKDEAAVKRFQREVEAAARLSHPNIVAALDARNERGVWCLVMEYVEGCDLAAVVKDRGPLPVQEAVGYILQAARGLAYAHEEGVIHRDIKPANLLLDKKGVVKILDMGLARIDAEAEAADHQLTGTGQVMGTVDYMAPEQAANTHKADARSDVYSLGCSLYRLLVGESMFGGQTMVEKILAHMNDAIPSLCQKQPDAPAELDRIFQKMVAKKPADRYQQTTALVADLEAFLDPREAATSLSAMREPDDKLSDFLRAMNQPSSPHSSNQPGSPHSSNQPGSPHSSPLAPSSGRGVGGEGSAAIKSPTKTAPADEQTIAHLGPEIDTDPKSEVMLTSPLVSRANAIGSREAQRGRKPPLSPKLIAGGIGGLALLVALGIWVIIRDKDGNEVARVQVPDGGSITVAPRSSGESASKGEPASTGSAPLAPVLRGEGSGVRGPQPSPAVAPFDAKTARAHQEAWAAHLATKVETNNSIGMKMVLIPPGEFLMGSTDEQVAEALKAAEEFKADQSTKDRIQNAERPQHKVVISKPFLMGATEVTIGQFQKFVEASKYVTEAEQYGFGGGSGKTLDAKVTEAMKQQKWRTPGYAVTDEHPVTQVTWNDACAFCNWLSESEQRTPCYTAVGDGIWFVEESANGYRLPTEARWEYACRAGTTTQYSFGDDWRLLGAFGWYNAISNNRAWPVGLKRGNPFGLHDMHGNVYEWCQDYWDEKWYEKASLDSPNGPVAGSTRVIRGGIWYHNASCCRSAFRYSDWPSNRNSVFGFRVVREWEVRKVAVSGTTVTPSPPIVPSTAKPAPIGPQPPPAVAPFDAKTARSHQDAWAKHLGVKVETPNSVGQTMILIPPGEFLMGSTDEQVEAALQLAEEFKVDQATKDHIQNFERPQHKVVIAKPYLMSAAPVTIGQFKKFSATGYRTQAEKVSAAAKPAPPVEAGQPTPQRTYLSPGYAVTDDVPAAWIDWFDAMAYCKWLGEQENRTYRLPTEAEWEYACRAGTTTQYSFGDDYLELSKYGWHSINAGGKLHPVGTLLPNNFGLFDMHGALWQWCEWATNRHETSPLSEIDGLGAASARALRGGSSLGTPAHCRSAYRHSNLQAFLSRTYGFRIVAEVQIPSPRTIKPPPVTVPAKTENVGPQPPPAVAPFDAKTAHAHQDAWAKYLGLPVENEITLPGGVQLTLVLIPPGEFLMGSNDADRAKFVEDAIASKHATCADRIPSEGPQHRVRITRPFYLAKHETTQAQWKSVMGNNPAQFPNDPNQPVESLCWDDIPPYLEKLNANADKNLKFALPTEAQWEFACRAGGMTAWHSGDSDDELRQVGWFRDDISQGPHSVGLLQANPFGLHDMHGNVWEWCADWHSSTYYAESPTDDPPGPAAQTCRVQRGGGWSDRAKYGRSAFRYEMQPNIRHNHYGFRLAAAVDVPGVAK